MTRLPLLLALVLSLAFAGTALATEDDPLVEDGPDVCAIDDGDGEGEDFFGEDEPFEGEDHFDDFDEGDGFGEEEEPFGDEELFRARVATAELDDCVEPDAEAGPETTPDPDPAPRKPRGTKGDDRLVGDDGRDRFLGRRGNDFLDGRGAADYLNGGPGDDQILTGAAPRKGDRVLAGAGTDLVRARNGARDRIDCGRGRDTVYADAGDRVRKSCETVKYR